MSLEFVFIAIAIIALIYFYKKEFSNICPVNHFEQLCGKVAELEKELEELKGYVVNIQYKMNNMARPVIVCRDPDENDRIENNKIGCFWINKVTGRVWKFCENRNGPLDSGTIWVEMEEGLL